jgi:hypothetical protein
MDGRKFGFKNGQFGEWKLFEYYLMNTETKQQEGDAIGYGLEWVGKGPGDPPLNCLVHGRPISNGGKNGLTRSRQCLGNKTPGVIIIGNSKTPTEHYAMKVLADGKLVFGI